MSQLQALVSDAPASIGGAAHPLFSCARGGGGLDASCVRVAGELDLAAAEQLTEALREAKGEARLVALNPSELAFLDAAGSHTTVPAPPAGEPRDPSECWVRRAPPQRRAEGQPW